jgi:hypothetical protein
MMAGLLVPERPIGNMYFSAWSHTVVSNCTNLSADLKMGEYRKPSISGCSPSYRTLGSVYIC